MIPLPDGLAERVTHHRVYQGGMMMERSLRELGVIDKIEPRGGKTVVEIFKGDDVVAFGVCRCNPKETYDKRMGRIIARGRALAELDGRAQARRDRREELAREDAIRELDTAKRISETLA